MSEKFSNKVIWVIGASSGIGQEFAKQSAEMGAKIILSARNEEALLKTKKLLANPASHWVFSLDLENLDQIESKLGELIKITGPISLLFNNGGISQRGEVKETTIDVDRRIMEINYFGNIQLTKAILPYFISRNGGHIVVISSIAGKFGFFLRSAYSAAKHALHGFYESLRLEAEKHNVCVTIICPGKINTPISTNALTANGEQHGKMDHNQATGMSVEQCVQQIIGAIKKEKREVLIGNREIKAVYIKRFFPGLFYRIIRKQSAT